MTSLNRLMVAAALATLPGHLAAQRAGDGRELVLEAGQGFEIIVEVNDVPLRLRVDPGATGVIMLNPGAAERARLRPGRLDKKLAVALGLEPKSGGATVSIDGADVPLRSAPPGRTGNPAAARTQLGPVRLLGKFTLARAAIQGRSEEKVFGWFSRDVVSGADGVINPAALPFTTVTFKLRDPTAGERLLSFGVDYSALEGLVYRHPIGGHRLNVKWSVLEPATTATAAAAAVISAQLDGRWAGESRMHSVGLGVTRPVRPLKLSEPLKVQALSLDSMLVRTRDHRGDHSLPSDKPLGDDSILVTARSAQQALYVMVVGQDSMSGCSKVSYLRPNRIELTCR